MSKNFTNEASSNINWFEYDPAKRELVVEFKGCRQYKYLDVPQHIVTAFQMSGSFGTFHNKNIRGHYKEQKIEQSATPNNPTLQRRRKRSHS